MELTWTPPNLILNAVPAFIILLLLELGVGLYEHRALFKTKDTLSSLAMGIGNLLIGLMTKGVVFGAYMFCYQYRLWDLPTVGMGLVGTWAVLFFAEDLSYYWMHRTAHTVRYFWASHVVHHSSQHYNLGTALRQTWTGGLSGGFVFWLWLPLLGFHPQLVLMQQSISLLYQFWIHTELINKLPRPIEWFFNTPSHHRVHHSSDIMYLDKNHAGILIIWDRLFGTFQEEHAKPQYGLTSNLQSHNPFVIAFHEWGAIAKDLWGAKSFRERWLYLFGPPGWSADGSRKTTAQLRAEWEKEIH